MSLSNENNPVVINAYMGTVSTAGDYPVAHLPKKFILKKVVLLNQADITADGTDYVTLTLKNGATSLASYDSQAGNQGAVDANVAAEFSLAAEVTLDALSDLKLTYAEGGTGTLTSAQVVLYGQWK